MLKFFLFCVSLLSALETEPVVLLGGGIGSLTSAIYLGRAGFSPLVIEGKMPGGLLTQSHSVQNWPGEIEINGLDLTDKIHAQAEHNGARFLNAEVIGVDFSKRPLMITVQMLDGSNAKKQIAAESCIIGMGTQPNYLGVPGEKEFWGKGVTNCAICDGALYKDKIVGVVGGGDAAVLEALYLSNIAKEVYIFVRKNSLRAIEEKRVAILKEMPNVRFIYNTTVEAIEGNGNQVTGVVLKEGKKKGTFPLDGLFLAIGSTPNSKLFANALKVDKKGYIVLTKDQQTSVKGVYAVGDIVDPVYKQAVSAAGDGSKAALQAQHYLEDKVTRGSPNVALAAKPILISSGDVIDISSVEQFEEEYPLGKVIVDFYATWCPPCRRIAPVFEASAKKLAGKVKFMKVNVDKLPDLSTQYGIQGMPTAILFEDGQELERKSGAEHIAELLQKIEANN